MRRTRAMAAWLAVAAIAWAGVASAQDEPAAPGDPAPAAAAEPAPATQPADESAAAPDAAQAPADAAAPAETPAPAPSPEVEADAPAPADAAPATPAPPADAPAVVEAGAEELRASMIQAYRDTRTYRSLARFELRRTIGQRTSWEGADFEVALDRETGRVMVDKPSLRMVVEDGRLMLRSEEIPGRHLEINAPQPLDYRNILAAVPFLSQPPPADLALLLADDPIAALTNDGAADMRALPPAEDDPRQRPRLQVAATVGEVTFFIEPSTRLVTRLTIEIDGGAAGLSEGSKLVLAYEIDVRAHNEPLAEEVFLFEREGSMPAASIEAWVQGPAAGPGPAPGEAPGAVPAPGGFRIGPEEPLEDVAEDEAPAGD